MRYENEICSGCRKPFCEGEDVVVCPVCATPQHRECWNKTNSCVNGYLHAAGYEWQPEGEAESEGLECPYCGRKNAAEALHCEGCGGPLTAQSGADGAPFSGAQADNPFEQYARHANPFMNGVEMNAEERIGGEAVGDLAIYARRNAGKFMPKFRGFAESGKKISWNWAAFFLAPYWFFYRKMTRLGLLFLGILLGINLCAAPALGRELEPYYLAANEFYELAGDSESTEEQQLAAYNEVTAVGSRAFKSCVKNPVIIASGAAFVLLHAAAALVADGSYYKKALRDMHILRENAPNDGLFRSMLLRVGGVSPLGFVAGMFGYNALFRLLMMLAESIAS